MDAPMAVTMMGMGSQMNRTTVIAMMSSAMEMGLISVLLFL